jgi:hypothetical protein
VALGPTPLRVRRPLGPHSIELGRAGFTSQQKWVTVGPEPGDLRVGLVHQPPPHDDTVPVEVAEIESMVRRRATQIRACYERRLKRDPSLAATVGVEESTLPDPLVGECLRREAAGWSFSVGRNAQVVYPFVFRSQ